MPCRLFQLRQNDDFYTDIDDDESESDVIGLQPPKMSLIVSSQDSAQICLSKVYIKPYIYFYVQILCVYMCK